MIPYIDLPQFELFGRVFQPFGLLVMSGILASYLFARRRARQAGIPARELDSLYLTVAVTSSIGSHLLYLFYNPAVLERDGWLALLRTWDGMESIGGIFGGALGIALYLWLRPAPARGRKAAPPALVTADILVQSFVVLWIFGRLGCAVVHDHPGRLTSFFLGVRFPDGVRHDLGLDEFLFTLLVWLPLILALHRSRFGKIPGVFVAAVPAIYLPVRFAVDFLRATDTPHPDERWLGITLAQYFCVAALAFSVWTGRRVFGTSGFSRASSQAEITERINALFDRPQVADEQAETSRAFLRAAETGQESSDW